MALNAGEVETVLKLKDELSGQLAVAKANLKSFAPATDAAARSVENMGAAAKKTAIPVTDMHASLQQFDGVLASVGIHIGPEIRAIGELGEASGKSASQLGVLGTAGLVLGAAAGGWKIGRLVADFFDLDQKIGGAAAKLLGWGDVAGQQAGAKADAIQRAFELTGRRVTTVGEALSITTEWLTAHNKKAKDAEKVNTELAAAMVELNSAGIGWQGTLDTINGTVVEAVKFYLEAGVSQGALATAYGLTDVQVKAVVSSMKSESDALTRLNDEQEHWHALTLDIAKSLGEKSKGLDLLRDRTEKQTAASLAEYEANVKLNASWGLDAKGALAIQKSALDVLNEKLRDLHRVKEVGISQSKQEQVLTNEFTDALLAEARTADAAALTVADASNRKKEAIDAVSRSYAEQAAAALAVLNAERTGGPKFSGGFTDVLGRPVVGGGTIYGINYNPTLPVGPPRFAEGGTVIVGEQGPERVALPSGSTVFPHGSGGDSIINNFYVNGTAVDVARQIQDILMREQRNRRKFRAT